MNGAAAGPFDAVLDRLTRFPGADLSLDLPSFGLLLLISLFSSLALAAAYLRFYDNRATGSQIHRAFPLLGLGITTLFVCIQFSLPLSLGLLGALSIIRFRTPIKEPEEIGFLMVLVASSIAIATGNVAFLAMLLGVSLVALVILRWGPGPLRDPMKRSFLSVTLATDAYATGRPDVAGLVARTLKGGRLESVTKGAAVTVLTFAFDRVDASGAAALERDLREAAPDADYTLYHEGGGA